MIALDIVYITGIIMQGPRCTGYAITKPSETHTKPDLVSKTELRQYLLTNKYTIANATVDSFGEAHFRTADDQKSYVTLNPSGYHIGFAGRPLSKLHDGNIDKDPYDNSPMPGSSIIVLDLNEKDNVAEIMNMYGVTKMTHYSTLQDAVLNKGLIASNIKVENNKLLLLSKSLFDLKCEHSANPQAPVKTSNAFAWNVQPEEQPKQPIQQAQPTQKEEQKPTGFSWDITDTKEPTPEKKVEPIKSELQQPVKNQGFAWNKELTVPTIKEQMQDVTTSTTKPVEQPVVEVVQPVINSNTKQEFNLYKQVRNYGFRITKKFVEDCERQPLAIRIDLDKVDNSGRCCDQYETVMASNDKIILKYYNKADDPLDFAKRCGDESAFAKELLKLNSLLLKTEYRDRLLNNISIDLYYYGEHIDGIEYYLLYREIWFVGLIYAFDMDKMDVVRLAETVRGSKASFPPCLFNPNLSLIYLPNMVLGCKDYSYVPCDWLGGTIDITNYQGYEYYNLLAIKKPGSKFAANTIEKLKFDNLIIKPHPNAVYTKMLEDDPLRIYIDYPFGVKLHMPIVPTNADFIAKTSKSGGYNNNIVKTKITLSNKIAFSNCYLDLSNTKIQSIPNNTIMFSTFATYNLILPDSCTKIEKGGVSMRTNRSAQLCYTEYTTGQSYVTPESEYTFRPTYFDNDKKYTKRYRLKSYDLGVKNAAQLSKIIINGKGLLTIDNNGCAFNNKALYMHNITNTTEDRYTIVVKNAPNLKGLTKTTILAEDLPRVEKYIDLSDYYNKLEDHSMVDRTKLPDSVQSWFAPSRLIDKNAAKNKLSIITFCDSHKQQPHKIASLQETYNYPAYNLLIEATTPKVNLYIGNLHATNGIDTVEIWQSYFENILVEEGVEEFVLTFVGDPKIHATTEEVKDLANLMIGNLFLPASLKLFKLNFVDKFVNYYKKDIINNMFVPIDSVASAMYKPGKTSQCIDQIIGYNKFDNNNDEKTVDSITQLAIANSDNLPTLDLFSSDFAKQLLAQMNLL